ncbi:MAG: 3-hydroxyacyl-CoA dehydrogenase family protein [Bryobacteraceae bacterium]
MKPVGIAGLGLLGRGIAASLLAHGFSVVAYNRTARRAKAAQEHIAGAMEQLAAHKLLDRARLKTWRRDFRLVRSVSGLADCEFAIESVKEDLALKRAIFDELESVVAPDAVIASNTSSIPISDLQKGRKHPERFIGMHWGEPAEIMRYLEVIPGKRTSPETLRRTLELGKKCGKDPSALNYDIRGFISNRLMYAMLREALYLVEAGVADIETVDRSFRNDMGWWATLAGPFRWMDLTGIPAYAVVAEGLFPKLANTRKLPKTMRDMVASGANGISGARGFYKYNRRTAKQWERAWVEFTYDIRKLVEKYEARVKA